MENRQIDYNPSVPFKFGILELRDNPDVLIRTNRIENLYETFNIADETIIASKVEENYNLLKSCGISLPDPRIFVGQRYGGDSIDVVVDKIEGEILTNCTFGNKDFWSVQLEMLCLKQIDYISDRLTKNEPFLHDIFHEAQYMYGR